MAERKASRTKSHMPLLDETDERKMKHRQDSTPAPLQSQMVGGLNSVEQKHESVGSIVPSTSTEPNRSPKWRVGKGPNRFQLVTCWRVLV